MASFTYPHAGDQQSWLDVWDVATGAALLHQETTIPALSHLGFSPDGRHIAFTQVPFGRGKPALHVRDVASGKDLWTRPAQGGHAFSPDGRRLAMALADCADHKGTLIVDAATGEDALQLQGEDGYSDRVAFSPDGLRILTVGRAARLWERGRATS